MFRFVYFCVIMAIEVRSMPFNYQLQKEGKDFSLFQDSEYTELNLTDIELFCEDYLCNDFKRSNS